MDEMKEGIAENVTDEMLFILLEAKRLSALVRYWLEVANLREAKLPQLV